MYHNQKEQNQNELLNIQNNAEESQQDKQTYSNKQQLLEKEPIKDTPFHIVGNTENGYFLAFGKHRLTEPKPTKTDALNLLSLEKWNIIANLIIVIHDTLKTFEKNEQTNTTLED